MTARPWPEGTSATALALLEWLRTTDTDEAVLALDGLLESAQRAERCVIAAHDDELTYLNRALTRAILETDRYRRAWHSARRRAADPNHAADVLEALALTAIEEDPSRCACGTLTLDTTPSERHDRGLHGPDRCIDSLAAWRTPEEDPDAR